MNHTYTIAIATRLRRKIFNALGIRDYTVELLHLLGDMYSIDFTKIEFRDDGLMLELSCEQSLDINMFAYKIRAHTSKKIRETFKELWSLPSLWTKNAFIKEGTLDNKKKEDIDIFFSTLKTR